MVRSPSSNASEPDHLPSAAAADTICEMMTIGAGEVSTALSKLLGRRRVMLSLPYLLGTESLSPLDEADRDGVAVRVRTGTGLNGTFVVWLDADSATAVVEDLLGHESPADRSEDLVASVLLELGNISACAFGEALSKLVHTPVIPEPPEMLHGALGETLATVAAPTEGSTTVVVEMGVDALQVQGWLAFVLDTGAAAWGRLGRKEQP